MKKGLIEKGGCPCSQSATEWYDLPYIGLDPYDAEFVLRKAGDSDWEQCSSCRGTHHISLIAVKDDEDIERNKRIRRRVEDRIRKDEMSMLEVAYRLNIDLS